jgi:hypothetical protein
VVGGLVGGARHYQKRQETVTVTRPNPDHQAFMAAKGAYRNALEDCLAARQSVPQ